MMKVFAIIINCIAGMFIGYVVGTVIKRFRTQIQKILIWLVNFGLDKNVYDKDHQIVSIYHLYENYDHSLSKLEMKPPGSKCFHLRVEAPLKGTITDNTDWEDEVEYLDSPEETAENAAGAVGLSVPEFRKELSEVTEKVTTAFHNKIKENYPFFNGEMYGICGMKVTKSDRRLIMDSFRSDYYTHRIMAALYEKRVEEDKKLLGSSVTMCRGIWRKPKVAGLAPGVDKYKYFLTALGVDILIYLADENAIVLTKRSDKLFGMKKPRWHMSVNEAVSITDLEDNEGTTISLEKCVKRGIKEELGVSLGKFDHKIVFADMFMLKKPIELGLSAFVSISGISFDELEASYDAAKDGEFETTNITYVNCSYPSIKRFLSRAKKDDDITAAGEYLLRMFLARYNSGVFID